MKPLFYYSMVLFLYFTIPSLAQKKQLLTDEEQVTEMVTKEMDELFKSKDFLKQKDKKFKDVKGTIVTDVGIIQSGKVSTFFKVDSEIDNPNFTNFLSEYILEHKFYFKLQKQQRYKVRYSITF